MSKEVMGRLVLEASTGAHGYVAKDLAVCLAKSLEQRAELLEALQEIVAAADGAGWSQLDATLAKARAAITKAEAAE